MTENDYDELKEFASRVQNDLMYDVKLHTTVMRQYAQLIQAIINQINPTPEQPKHIERLVTFAEKIENRSSQTDEKLDEYYKLTHKILKSDYR